MTLLKKIYLVIATSSITCSSGALISFLNKSNKTEKIENLGESKAVKAEEFKFDSHESIIEHGFFESNHLGKEGFGF